MNGKNKGSCLVASSENLERWAIWVWRFRKSMVDRTQIFGSPLCCMRSWPGSIRADWQLPLGRTFSWPLTHIHGEGNAKQKEQYLIPGIKGELIGCMAVTEPFGGSDVQALRTTAIREGEYYVINGSKTFITNGVLSDYIVAAVKTDPEANANGISMMIIERDRPGVSATKLKKLGWHASDTGEIAFDEVRVPLENLLGQENQGFFYIMQHFVSERLAMALGAVASSAYALELTLPYMSERTAFGRPINRFQVLRHSNCTNGS